ITLNGENFPIKKSYINLTLDGIVCEVLNVSKNTIRFVLPNNLNKSNNQVVAKISMVNVSAGELKVLPPAIDNIANSVLSMYTNPALVITGSNFSPLTTKNEVKIGGYLCHVLSSSLNQLTIEAPRGIIPDVDLSVQDTFDIVLRVLDQFAVIENKIEVSYLSRWTRMRDFPGSPRVFGTSFTINQNAYVGLGSGEDFDSWYKDFWEYNPLNDSWTKLPDFPGAARSKFVTLVINSKAYIITGTIGNQYTATNNLNEVWEFDPSTKSWTQKSNFPGGARYGAFGFVINEYGYVGAGVYGNYTPKYDFWKYDAENDNWVQLNNLSNSLWYEDIFALSNNIDGYILTNSCGSPCGKRYFWKYDKVNDAWLDVVDMPGPYDET
ncbi:MAG: IPT/TIG domain-containing protein, partial [Cyclobacteriaceae bacterium]|nr:IPT/TIG domain-containing protein [Cyclobacteriaceae bacterium]